MSLINCVQGDFAEALLISEVLRRGGEVTKPFGGHSPYDLVVRFKRGWKTVQVKSCRGTRDCRKGATHIQKSFRASDIDREKVDFTVVLYVPDTLWWIIPVREMPTNHHIALSNRRNAAMSRFFNAWSLLT